MIRRTLPCVLLSLSLGCSVTNTGNPHSPSAAAPDGIELARSTLARERDVTLTDDERTRFAADNRSFAFALYAQLKARPGNLFFSPYSISTALAMTYAGAKAGTASEMESALHFGLGQPRVHDAFNALDLTLAGRANQLVNPQATGDGFKLALTNASFVAADLRLVPAYLDQLARSYDAGLYRTDFAGHAEASRQAINSWVLDRTEQRIDELLPAGSIGPDAAFVLVNAIYFKASWLDKFDPAHTESATFHAADGDRQVQMMRGFGEQYFDGDGYQALELPYVSDAVRMLFVLPDEGSFDAVEARLDDTLFTAATKGLSRHSVDLGIPRFSFESEVRLRDALMALGMRSAFGNADFSGMAGAPGDLVLDQVYHKAFVAVDEQGTEAAAATAAVGREVSAPPPATFILDRPFLFFVYDAPTKQVLFSGRVSAP